MGKRVKADHELLDVIDDNNEQREFELEAEAEKERETAMLEVEAEKGPGGKPPGGNGQRPLQVRPAAQTGAKRSRLLFEWRNAFSAMPARELSVITRCVLWVVSRLMNVDGTGARQGQRRIARESGLTVRAVKHHLKLAEKLGWLKRERNIKSLYGIGYQYVANIPEGAAAAAAAAEESQAAAGGQVHDKHPSPQVHDKHPSPQVHDKHPSQGDRGTRQHGTGARDSRGRVFVVHPTR